MVPAIAGAVPLKDNVLFGFERCKSLGVDLEKGQLKESVSSSFDMVCRKKDETQMNCDYFETGSSKKISEGVFSGGSDLGVAELKDKEGRKLRFLIGKNYASFESGPEQKVCVGIYLFEQDAIKKSKTN
jgi:chromosome condensin MukBEF MukE localization factor